MNEIPKDVVAIAEALFPGNAWNPLVVERVARAIMTERERCAKVAHAWMHDNGLDANAADVALVILGAGK